MAQKYYKTVVHMLSHAFAEMGYEDGDGNPIQPEGEAMTEEEWIEDRVKFVEEEIAPLFKSNKSKEMETKVRYTLSQLEGLFEDYMLARLQSKLSSKGIYSVFCNDFEAWPAPKESEYDFLGEYYKWSTHRAKIVKFGLRWDFKKDDWVMSYHKQGSSKMAPL